MDTKDRESSRKNAKVERTPLEQKVIDIIWENIPTITTCPRCEYDLECIEDPDSKWRKDEWNKMIKLIIEEVTNENQSRE